MRRTAALFSVCLVGLGLLVPTEAFACGAGLGWFGGSSSGGLWQRPPRDLAFEPHTIILMGNEALGIPAGVEVDVTPLPAPPPTPLERVIAALSGFPGFIEFDSDALAALVEEHS